MHGTLMKIGNAGKISSPRPNGTLGRVARDGRRRKSTEGAWGNHFPHILPLPPGKPGWRSSPCSGSWR
jgi:hypothetical protein